MSRQHMRRRARKGETHNAQRAAGELRVLREQYEVIGPDHSGFEEVIGRAAVVAANLEGNMRVMSRPAGSSRRAAGERFMASCAIGNGPMSMYHDEAISPNYEAINAMYEGAEVAGTVTSGDFARTDVGATT